MGLIPLGELFDLEFHAPTETFRHTEPLCIRVARHLEVHALQLAPMLEMDGKGFREFARHVGQVPRLVYARRDGVAVHNVGTEDRPVLCTLHGFDVTRQALFDLVDGCVSASAPERAGPTPRVPI